MTSEQIPDGSNLVPRRTAFAWRDEGERVVVERLRPGAFRRRVLRLFGIPAVTVVRLDPLGSQAWRLMDGTRTAADISRRLAAAFPDQAEVAPRLGRFLGTMASQGLLELGAR